MSQLIRFGIAIDDDILRRFDAHIKAHKYSNRSEAIRDLIRKEFLQSDWTQSNKEVVGVVTVLYDHHKRGLVNQLLAIQHHHPAQILCSQHVHLDHHECLEVIVARGKQRELQNLCDLFKSKKGVEMTHLSSAAPGLYSS